VNGIKKSFLILRDVFEIYIPVLAFSVMFLTFILQIIARYIFNYPLTWTYEVTVIGFSWTVVFGACYAMRHRSHVKFTLLYDMLSPKPAAVMRLAGNVVILVAFIILFKPAWDYITFMNFQSTPVFKIKLSWVFSGFIYFVFSMILYTAAEIVEDIKILIKKSEERGDVL
jgi:TRAP-type C4-dicarboxylate transport system permease small subunit